MTNKAAAKSKESKQANTIPVIGKKELLEGLDKARKDMKVAALTSRQGRKMYDLIESSAEIEWDYLPTVLSPKKFFFPAEEVILEYQAQGAVQAKASAEPILLFGIRPCDLNGIKIMGEAFAESKGDPNYLNKREQAIVIGLDCLKLCSEDAFCYRVKSNYAEAGFDIFLTDLGEELAVHTATPKGKKFVAQYLELKEGSKAALEKFEKDKKQNFSKVPPFKRLDEFPEIFEKSKDHIIWEEVGQQCLSCGSCIMVCPTCYCFDIADELALNLKTGQRLRRWDACMLNSFAVVASGENFRHNPRERLFHRLNRKFNFLMKKHGQAVCVGCGRCVRACLADISPKRIAKVLSGEKL